LAGWTCCGPTCGKQCRYGMLGIALMREQCPRKSRSTCAEERRGRKSSLAVRLLPICGVSIKTSIAVLTYVMCGSAHS
jgi:hypothetical protein